MKLPILKIPINTHFWLFIQQSRLENVEIIDEKQNIFVALLVKGLILHMNSHGQE